ncbi:glycine betaine ABC transporter substrate-binding protein [Oceanivirga salmonicida]|uniref:glycine betaine ABC transporter substrate-binding protein n=1 Tax=Oceanivirga salmonicida TaxID=1769291 RepID=UPI00082D2E94|nr:glycine betaine ABC transporter substrate-binding protein [Oceanivirga salmonicida]
MIKKIMSVIITTIMLVGCGSNSEKVKIGSKNFTESLVIAEIYAQALEKENIEVERVFNISGTLVHKAIINKDIDLYPEYTGTGLLSILKLPLETDPQKVYEIVKKEYKEKFNIKWLELTKVHDGQGLVVRTEIAEKYNIYTISDLQKNADKIRFATQGEFHKREDALPLLEKVYGKFNWQSFKLYSNELKYSVLESDSADSTIVYTTEGSLVKKDKFTLLKDDKNAWPPYNLVAIVREDTLEKNSKIEEILNEVGKKLNSEIVIKLNAMVDIGGIDYETVAKKFLNGSIDE